VKLERRALEDIYRDSDGRRQKNCVKCGWTDLDNFTPYQRSDRDSTWCKSTCDACLDRMSRARSFAAKHGIQGEMDRLVGEMIQDIERSHGHVDRILLVGNHGERTDKNDD